MRASFPEPLCDTGSALNTLARSSLCVCDTHTRNPMLMTCILHQTQVQYTYSFIPALSRSLSLTTHMNCELQT